MMDLRLRTTLQNSAIAFQQESNYPQALTSYQQALNIAEQQNDLDGEAYINLNIGITYTSLDENKRAEEAYFKAIVIAQNLKLKNVLYTVMPNDSLVWHFERLSKAIRRSNESSGIRERNRGPGNRSSQFGQSRRGIGRRR